MKGKREFSENEANQIRKLIKDKLLASSTAQKGIRNKIRDLKFYFSDFSEKKGYTIDDFENLIRNGEIKIIGGISTFKLESNKLKKEIPKQKISNSTIQDKSIEQRLFDKNNFKEYSCLNTKVLDSTGFYCLKLKNNSKLPIKYQTILDKRTIKYLYIGKAEGQSLRERLEQEIEHKSPGTFFRSIGCVLGYLPMKGHLKGKSNQNNFKFSPSDTLEIIKWLKLNIELSIVENNCSFNKETDLIKKYCPLLNDTHNPMKLQELKDDKAKCREIARG